MPAASFVLSALLSLPLPLSGGSNLMAAAAAAGRPPECAARTQRAIARGPTVWERARVPSLQRYCDLVARAHAQLAARPEAARDAAELADKAMPGHAAPAVILARAALALGEPQDAAREFARARAVDPRSVEDPSTMHDLARTLRLTGKREEALAIYRALVPRIDLLGSTDRRVSALLEAAHAAMAAATQAQAAQAAPAAGAKQDDEVRARLDEAIAYLREARQRPPTQLVGDVLLSLVLALDRSGDKAHADAALGDAAETGARPRASDYLSAEEDRLALEALALERSDAAGAIEKWQAFLAGAGGKGPWAAGARARVDELQRLQRLQRGAGAKRAPGKAAATGGGGKGAGRP